jgi:beta-glucosidase
MRRIPALLPLLLAAAALAQSPTQPLYKDTLQPVDARVADLLAHMTLTEKATLLSGSGWMESPAIDRLGIPSLLMADGPMGVRAWYGSSAITNQANSPFKKVLTTSFPSGIAMAATWDPAIVQREGQAIGQETHALGRNMILGPTVNINRVPLWGRNFEGYGEDPWLTSRLAIAYIQGVQSEGVVPSLKHFAANNEEFERHRIDAHVDERTLNEIYLPAFKAGVQEGHVWTVMSAYNKLNGTYCAENPVLLQDYLRKQWGFQGLVVSDWGSTYSTAPTVNAGMDLEMPGGPPFIAFIQRAQTQLAGNSGGWLAADKVLAEVASGHISEATVTANAGHILHVLFVSGIFDHPTPVTGEVDTPAQQQVARQASTESIVLLKNSSNLLPLDASKLHSIAVIGPNAAVARTGGGGSSLVRPKYSITPLDGIRERAGSSITVNYALGVSMLGEDPAQDTPEARAKLLAEATDVAAKSDVAVVVVGRYSKLEGESFDIATMDLPAGQDELIAAVERANPRTIVVFNTGAAVTMTKWLDQTPALLDLWYPGQEGGHALASILFGDANPSGHLPVTLPKAFADSPAASNYPGQKLRVDYAEGIYVGYRYFDTKNVAPAFPFGYGLSYTTFALTNLTVTPGHLTAAALDTTPIQVSATIRNTGSRSGAQVVQLYVHPGHSQLDRPIHELKSFARVELAPGESKTLHFTLDRASLSYYNPASHSWIADPGQFLIQLGTSSRDLPLQATLELTR